MFVLNALCILSSSFCQHTLIDSELICTCILCLTNRRRVLARLAKEREHVEAEIGKEAEGLAESDKILSSLRQYEVEMQKLAFVPSSDENDLESPVLPPPPQFGGVASQPKNSVKGTTTSTSTGATVIDYTHTRHVANESKTSI